MRKKRKKWAACPTLIRSAGPSPAFFPSSRQLKAPSDTRGNLPDSIGDLECDGMGSSVPTRARFVSPGLDGPLGLGPGSPQGEPTAARRNLDAKQIRLKGRDKQGTAPRPTPNMS
ncbi:hypothetical protein BJY00DRAFT_277845 [Aspergillus carlsbadensis]|nr:hypothetical protein BJY00DRAFT_277845 [Aspergillus carlsbadensis]